MEGGVVHDFYPEGYGFLRSDGDKPGSAQLVSFHMSSCNVQSPPPRTGERVVFSRDPANNLKATSLFRVDCPTALTPAPVQPATCPAPPMPYPPKQQASGLTAGVVVKYDDERAFGFIRPSRAGSRDVFFRANVVQDGPLRRGESVVFFEIMGPKGPQATTVRRVHAPEEPQMSPPLPPAVSYEATIPGVVVMYSAQGAFGSITKLDGSAAPPLPFVIGDCDIKRPLPTVGERVMVHETMGPKGPRASIVRRVGLSVAPPAPPTVVPPKAKPKKVKNKPTAPASASTSNVDMATMATMMQMCFTMAQGTAATTTPPPTPPPPPTTATTPALKSEQYKAMIQHLSSPTDSALYVPAGIAMLAQTRPRDARTIEAETNRETQASLLIAELAKALSAAVRREALEAPTLVPSANELDWTDPDDYAAAIQASLNDMPHASLLDFGYTGLPSPVATRRAPKPSPVPEPPRTVYCQICMDDAPIEDMFYISGCEHAYCRDSIRQYILNRIEQQDLTPKCPYDGCDREISDGDMTLVLTLDEQEKYYQECVNKAVVLEPTIHKCLAEGCHGIASLPLNDPHFVCPLCRAERCVQCNTSVWHDGLTCEQARQRGLDSQLHQDQLRNLFGGTAYQCGSCGFGPIEHQYCHDLQAHQNEAVGNARINNACPKCGWFAANLSAWPRWNGVMPAPV